MTARDIVSSLTEVNLQLYDPESADRALEKEESARVSQSVTSFERGKRLATQAHALIPGGCHTYAKGDDQFPTLAPSFIARGKGCRVWDLDDNEYIEYGMGLRSVTLGHAYQPVIDAVTRQLPLGTNY
ncbi:MAG TPA: hypothetical protein VFG04_27375, partial [Planctomycetaceae bacterium]|nr:hypothetical protein [Planctomycetaceae bacterium]